jgi:hypothetical protein
VYGRTDRFYLKTYEADTNADVFFVLDSSGSMDFTSGGLVKFDYARYLVASLAWLAQRWPGGRPDSPPGGGPQGWQAALAIPVEKLGRLLIIEDALRAAGVGAPDP